MNSTTELKVLNTTVATNEDGLFSLNDLWKASGGENKHQPKNWMRLKRTKGIISELKNELLEGGNSHLKTVINPTKTNGTFVCRELVYSYAMTVSPKFEIEVIRVFDKHAKKLLKMADLHGKAEWQQNRELGKLTHRKETDAIKKFLAYAEAQGSRNYPKHGYSLLAKMVNSALRIEDREAVSEETLHLLATADLITENALQRGMSDGLPYKVIFQQAKSEVNRFAQMAINFEMEA